MMESRKAVWTNKMIAAAWAAALLSACSPPQPVWGEKINPPDHVIYTNSTGMGTLEPGDSLVNQGGIVGENPNATGMTGMWLQRGGTALNSGYISLSGNGGTVYGVSSSGDMIGSGTLGNVVNTGSIAVTNVDTLSDTAAAVGISLELGGTASNTGFIMARSKKYACGISADAEAEIVNAGWITAVSEGNAFGIQMNSTGTVSNFGVINAVGQSGHELFLKGGSNATVRNWAVELRDFTNEESRPFFVSDYSKLDFNDGTLILRPGAAGEFALGREYKVKDMIASESRGTVEGLDTLTATAELPWLSAEVGKDAAGETVVALHAEVTRGNNPGQAAAVQQVAYINSQMRFVDGVLSERLRAAGAEERGAKGPGSMDAIDQDSGWSVFLTPYHNRSRSGAFSYHSRSTGLVGGAQRRVGEKATVGAHLGWSHTAVDGELLHQDGDSNTTLLGVHGEYRPEEAMYVRGQLSGFYSHGDTDWNNGAAFPLFATAPVQNYGAYASLQMGRAYALNPHSMLTPELGLSWLRQRQKGYALRWQDRLGVSMSHYDSTYAAETYQALYGTFMLRWQGDYAVQAGRRVRPQLGLGVRRRLTNAEIGSAFQTLGSSFSTQFSEDRNVTLLEAGAEWMEGDTSLTFSYSGEFGSDLKANSYWLAFKREF